MRLTLANAKAIKHACLKFHYAKSVPSVQYGFNVYNDDDEWCGVICYGGGATPNIGKPFGLMQGEILELVRVALNGKQKATSECVAASLRELHRIDPILKMVVSYADLDQNHIGTIYQATNWLYLGQTSDKEVYYIINGIKTHRRSVYAKYGRQDFGYILENVDENAKKFIVKGKHRYIFVFDKRLRKQWLKQHQPYPKKRSEMNGE